MADATSALKGAARRRRRPLRRDRRALPARHGARYTVDMIAEGTLAPDFTLEDQFGEPFHLAEYRGTYQVLLLFYPLDWTPT